MTEHRAERAQLSADIDAAALQKAEEYIEQEEGAANKLKGWLGAFITLVARCSIPVCRIGPPGQLPMAVSRREGRAFVRPQSKL